MKALVSRQSIIIASIAVLIAIITVVSVNAFSNPGPVTGIANAISRPIRNVASTVTGVFERIYSSIYLYDDLVRDFERIERENTELRQNFRDAIRLAEENEQLRAQLGFREHQPNYDNEIATVVGRSGSNWSHSFTINLGEC
jgi:cell shape-determining protein MreC